MTSYFLYILNNKIALDAAGVKQSYQQLLTEMSVRLGRPWRLTFCQREKTRYLFAFVS
ncbi:hypothetical protein [Nostoc sp. PCC 9305]|uniref:hypothetical protein n=1 Tax=Nostoc sp. PCC 9305 TaxID=296636 RepID=UPI0039C5CB02